MVALRPAVLDRYILSLDVAGFAHSLVECGDKRCKRAGRGETQEANYRHRLLLSCSREWPGESCDGQQDQEGAPVHSMPHRRVSYRSRATREDRTRRHPMV